MDYEIHLRQEARHLIEMADQPAFRGQAALRLKELQALDPMYQKLPELIHQERARMREEGKE